jgi:hypothetical protein
VRIEYAKQEDKLEAKDIVFRDYSYVRCHPMFIVIELMRYAINRKLGLLEDYDYPSKEAYQMFFKNKYLQYLTKASVYEIQTAIKEIKRRNGYHVAVWNFYSGLYAETKEQTRARQLELDSLGILAAT